MTQHQAQQHKVPPKKDEEDDEEEVKSPPQSPAPVKEEKETKNMQLLRKYQPLMDAMNQRAGLDARIDGRAAELLTSGAAALADAISQVP